MATFSHGHDWGWRMMACSRCGVQLTDYERGEPYQCGATPEPREWQKMGDAFGHEWSTERNSPFATDREAAPYCVHCGYRTWTTRATEPCAKRPPMSRPDNTPATVTNTGVTQTKRCKQFEMMGFHVRRGMNEEACVFCGRSEQDLATAGEPMRTGAESVFTHEGKNPLDRALEDFTARRKAKRLNAMAPGKSEGERSVYRCKSCGRVSETYFDCQCERTGGYLSRAMSTPLPHDTDIHTRLMPWKGKEDGQ